MSNAQNLGHRLSAGTPAWEGALALARALDRMVERNIDASAFVVGIEQVLGEESARRVIAGLLATGLLEYEIETASFALTREGRMLVIHATSIL